MPNLYNQTPYAVELLPLIDKEGANVLAIIGKGTFEFQERGGLAPAEEQIPVLMKDEFLGQEGQGEMRIPSDLADFKPATEVIVVRPLRELELTHLYGRNISVTVGSVRISGKVESKWPFGPLRRDTQPRSGFAGTYDQDWVENRMPLLPHDFDARFHLAAPSGQIAPGFLRGDEPCQAANLYADDSVHQSLLPGRALVVAAQSRYAFVTEVARLDTVLVWTESPRITLVWRHCIRLRQKVEEVGAVFVYDVRLRTARELFNAP